MSKKPREHCPKCDPCSPEMDEDGRPYACYFCGDTGWVPADVAKAYYQDQVDYAERFAPRRLGIFVQTMYDEWHHVEAEPEPGQGLFTRLVPQPLSRSESQRLRAGAWPDDDIPF